MVSIRFRINLFLSCIGCTKPLIELGFETKEIYPVLLSRREEARRLEIRQKFVSAFEAILVDSLVVEKAA